MSRQTQFGHLERFDNVDATGEEQMFFAFLDRVEGLPDVVKRRRRSYELLGIAPGQSVVDVGCGLGTATQELAARVGPSGHAHGVDISEAMIAEAKRRSDAAGVRVRFHTANVESLPLDSGSIHAYRAERLYQHLRDPLRALAEARRVLAVGGRLVLIDQDWDAAFHDSCDLAIARDIHRAFCDSLVNGTVGRQYRRLLLEAGFANVDVCAEAVTTANADQYGFVVDILEKTARGAIDPQRVDTWVADQRERIANDRFFKVMTHFIATATRD